MSRDYGLGEVKGKTLIPKLSQNLLALGIKPVNCMPIRFSDMNRIIAIRETSGIRYPSPEDPYGSFDAPATGKTMLTAYDGKPPQLTVFMVFKGTNVTLDNLEVRLTKDHLWGIHRLGTKESIVSVLDVSEFEPEQLIEGKVETQYSFPLFEGLKEAEPVTPVWVHENVINPFKLGAYDEGENPVINYVAGKNIVKYKLPIMWFPNIQPKHLIVVEKGAYCVYVRGDEKVVGRCL